MIARQKRCPELRFRKRPEPCRVISLDSLKRTKSGNESNDGPFVSHTGSLTIRNSWKPVPRAPPRVEVSKSGWKGLHSRMKSSIALHAEVA